jgi:hypothetical protein
MRTVAIMAALALAGQLFAGPVFARASEPAEVVPIGPAVRCIQIRSIRNTNVIDDSTIDFVMNGRKTLRNRLPNSCPQLAFERAFSYQTSIDQLCSVDIITVIVQGSNNLRDLNSLRGPGRLNAGSGLSGPSCGLGVFVPIATPARK